MNQKLILKRVEQFVKNKMAGEGTGHDFYHIERVRKLALIIAKKEKANIFIVELGALLHDIADWKFNADPLAGSKISTDLLKSLGVDNEIILQICHIIENISYKGGAVSSKMKTIEGKIVQDADRLDALGAIGIARAFAYGGYKKREIYNPKIKPVKHKTFESYRNSKGTSINHFYEKLLLIKDLMNTNSARKIAQKRHKFIEGFLKEFFAEW